MNREIERAIAPDKPPDECLPSVSWGCDARMSIKDMPLFEMGPVLVMTDPFDPDMERLYPNPYYNDIQRIGSFKQYLLGHFYQDYIGFLSGMIERGDVGLGKSSRLVPIPDRIHVQRADVQRIDLYRKSSEEVYADIIMSVEVTVIKGADSSLVDDALSQWYRVRTYHVLTPGEISFNNLVCIMIYDRNEPAPGRRLDEYLVPYVSTGVLDGEGADLLVAYYPESLQMPRRIEGEELARRMRLQIIYDRLTPDSSIRGQMYFEEREITVLDEKGRPHQRIVPENAVVIDLDSCKSWDGRSSKEKQNDAIIHECYHAYNHRLFYLGQRLYNEEIRCLSCSVTGDRAGAAVDAQLTSAGLDSLPLAGMTDSSFHRWTPVDWIEWQANRVTPRIRMPALTTRQKIDELARHYDLDYPDLTQEDIIAKVVEELAAFFEVSKESAKIRMVELGFPEAEGVFNYVNGKYVENHACYLGGTGKRKTFTIDFAAATELYQKNEAFRNCVSSGTFLYVDGHFCLNNPRYIYEHNHKLRLTPYAKANTEECCLAFTMRSLSHEYFYQEGTLQKEAGEAKIVADYGDAQANIADFLTESKRLHEIMDELPMSPSGTLRAHMDRRKVTIEGLAAESGVSEATIKRLRRDSEYRPTRNNAFAICIGLQLEPQLRRDWLRKVGIIPTTSESDIFYELILDSMYKSSIAEINQILLANHYQPLNAAC